MKKVILSFSLLLLTGGAFAQNVFGIKGGLNLAAESVHGNGETALTKIAPTFHLGAYYDYRVSRGFSIQPGLSLEGKGGKTKVGYQTFTDQFLYLQVPVNFLWRVDTRSGDFFLGGGPFFAYGIDARVKSEGESLKLTWGSGANQLSPFDIGLGTTVGYRFLNGLALSITNSYGFLNMANQGNIKYNNRVTAISVAYEFNKR